MTGRQGQEQDRGAWGTGIVEDDSALDARDSFFDLGYALLSEQLNKGSTTEAAAGVARHAFEDLERRELLGITILRNPASRRLLEELGMRLINANEDGGCVYKLTREEAAL